jgi:hypothetical protein
MAPIWASSAINWQAVEYNTSQGYKINGDSPELTLSSGARHTSYVVNRSPRLAPAFLDDLYLTFSKTRTTIKISLDKYRSKPISQNNLVDI